jgi:UDP-N-acetylmuramoyl-tripeptide--D-alanyl-D-alanine ligase
MIIPGLRQIKRRGKDIICTKLERQVEQLRDQHQVTVIAVVGSVGKTSTKVAIAEVLSTSKKVLYQKGNYNDRATVPLVFFNETLPALWNLPAWLDVFRRNDRQIKQANYPYDTVVLELGTDGLGQIAEFAYTKPDIAVVTALTPEHMEYFKTLDAVAQEELEVVKFARTTIINSDDAADVYLQALPLTVQTYSLTDTSADFYGTTVAGQALSGQTLTVQSKAGKQWQLQTALLGEPGAKTALAATAVAVLCGLSEETITRGVAGLQAFPGRLRRLPGTSQSTLLDDTYNASPAAVIAALDVLQATEAPQRIAILGSMNEMGATAEAAHHEVGTYCDPTKLSYVITIGKDANNWLAPAATAKGCQVKTFVSPYEAGAFVKSVLQPGALVLAKGSQNGVFAEEALKPLLDDPADQAKLVRQSPYWLTIKQKQFGSTS